MLQNRKKHTSTSAQKLSLCYVDSITIHKILSINSKGLVQLVPSLYSGFVQNSILHLKNLSNQCRIRKLENWKGISSTDLPLIKH